MNLLATRIVNDFQTIATCNIDQFEGAVVSVTQTHEGDIWNLVPASVVLRGATRSFAPAVRDVLEPAIRRISEGVCTARGADMAMRYGRRYPPTINSPAETETEIAAATAAALVAGDNVRHELAAEHGFRGFCLVSGKEAGRLYLDRE